MGSAIPVVSMDIRQQSIGAAVKHYTQSGASLTSRLPHEKKVIKKKSSFSPYRVL